MWVHIYFAAREAEGAGTWSSVERHTVVPSSQPAQTSFSEARASTNSGSPPKARQRPRRLGLKGVWETEGGRRAKSLR